MVKNKNVAYPGLHFKEKAYPGIKFHILALFFLILEGKVFRSSSSSTGQN